MSCNGCRVLRKGCSEDCSIRPCLQWIKNPEAQGNATVFLAKFYGRAGLLNLINAGPEHLRPAIFRSLLYEACGRIVNPIYGSVGLLWSGNWQMCQSAVDAVLKGAPIVQIPCEAAATAAPMPPSSAAYAAKSFDIRHVPKDASGAGTDAAHDLHKVAKASRTRFKRSGGGTAGTTSTTTTHNKDDDHDVAGWNLRLMAEAAEAHSARRAGSHESSGSHQWGAHHDAAPEGSHADASPAGEAATAENDSAASEETADGSMVTSHAAGEQRDKDAPAASMSADEAEGELDLTLGLGASSPAQSPVRRPPPKRCDMALDASGSDTCMLNLALDLAAA